MQELKPFKTLFHESWVIYKNHFGSLVGIMALPSLILILSPFLFKIHAVLVILGFLLGFIFSIVSGLALIYAIKDGGSVMSLYKKAFAGFWSYLWLTILGFLIIMGGMLMGIIPGIIFSIFFAFSVYIFVFEGEKGLSALLKSREYVRGYWWAIWWKIALMGLSTVIPTMLLGAIVSIVLSTQGMTPDDVKGVNEVVQNLANIFIVPLTIAYVFSLYKNLAQIKPELYGKKIEPKPKRGFWIFAAILGILGTLLVPFIFIMLLNPSGTLEKVRDTVRISDLVSLKTALGIYVTTVSNPDLSCGKVYSSLEGTNAIDGTGWIPVDLSSIVGGSPISELPKDPTNDFFSFHYTFACNSVNSTFEINALLESDDFGPGGINDQASRDGGNNPAIFEVGTDLSILP